MEAPLVSIITPVHNSSAYIQATIQSVLAQSYQHWEHILVDDASQDNSWQLIEEYSKQDARVVPIRSFENIGAAKARNLAISAAKGRFIAFLDADDIWLPNKLDVQIEFMLRNQAVITHTSYRWIDEDGNELPTIMRAPHQLRYSEMLDYNYIGCLTAIYDVQLTGGKVFMPDIKKRQDYALWLKILREGGEARGLDQVLALYRRSRNSLSSNKWDSAKYNFYLLTKIEKLPYWKAVYHFIKYFFQGIYRYFLNK